MEFFQAIWTSLTTPNEGLMKILFNKCGIPFIFIEITLHVLLFTTILNITSNKKQKISCVLALSLLSCISNMIFTKPYSSYINMLLYPICIILIFKISFFKAIIAELIPVMISSILEIILCNLYVTLFNGTYDDIYSIPLVRLPIAILIYLCTYFIYSIVKYNKININFNFNFNLLENMSKKNKLMLIFNFIFACFAIAVQFYIVVFYLNKLPLFISLISATSLISYFSISIFSLLETSKLEDTNKSLEEAKLYNKTLQILHDGIRSFRHDFSNIMQSIDGYVTNDDMNGLKKYYQGIKNECDTLNNLTALSPSLINDPAIYSLIASKYHLAENLGISFDINISTNINQMNISSYVLTRILGILLDNAIEAAENSKEKKISFEAYTSSTNSSVRKNTICIENSYANKDIDLDRIREKGFTTKSSDTDSHGIGLWNVNKILKKSKNLNLYTTKNNKFFKQQLEMFE